MARIEPRPKAMPCSSAVSARPWLMAEASSVPPVIPVMRSGARSRLPSSVVETSTSSTASSGSASCTRSTSSRSVVLPANSTSSASHSSRCERLRSLIVSAKRHLARDLVVHLVTHALGRHRDRERHDALRAPGGGDRVGLRPRGRERDPAVPPAGARGLRRRAHPPRRGHQARERRRHDRDAHLVPEPREQVGRARDRVEQRGAVAALDRRGRPLGGRRELAQRAGRARPGGEALQHRVGRPTLAAPADEQVEAARQRPRRDRDPRAVAAKLEHAAARRRGHVRAAPPPVLEERMRGERRLEDLAPVLATDAGEEGRHRGRDGGGAAPEPELLPVREKRARVDHHLGAHGGQRRGRRPGDAQRGQDRPGVSAAERLALRVVDHAPRLPGERLGLQRARAGLERDVDARAPIDGREQRGRAREDGVLPGHEELSGRARRDPPHATTSAPAPGAQASTRSTPGTARSASATRRASPGARRGGAGTAFGALEVTATTTRRAQKAGGAGGSATESRPSARSPRRHSTNPPKIERAAEPEPRRASAESAGGSSAIPAARLAASASAAKAAAEDARPTPRGTVLRVVTSARSRRPASARTRSRKRATRSASSPAASTPSISTRSASPPPKATDASTERPSSVSEMLPVAGRLSARSRFPQHFTSARFTLARAVVAGAAIPGGCLLSLWLASRTIGCLTDHSRPIGQAAAQENPRDPGKPSGPAGIAPDRVSPLYRMYRGVCQRSASTLPAPNA